MGTYLKQRFIWVLVYLRGTYNLKSMVVMVLCVMHNVKAALEGNMHGCQYQSLQQQTATHANCNAGNI